MDNSTAKHKNIAIHDELRDMPDFSNRTRHTSYEIRIAYEAGVFQEKQWSSGETVHHGVGWFHPFGLSEYFCGRGYAEEKDFSVQELFSEFWQETFDTNLFSVFKLDDGYIYAYDGVFCNRGFGDIQPKPGEGDVHRRDMLINVIVGGTGSYEGATGILLGTAEGSGKAEHERPGGHVPECLLKMMSGFMKIPLKEDRWPSLD